MEKCVCSEVGRGRVTTILLRVFACYSLYLSFLFPFVSFASVIPNSSLLSFVFSFFQHSTCQFLKSWILVCLSVSSSVSLTLRCLMKNETEFSLVRRFIKELLAFVLYTRVPMARTNPRGGYRWSRHVRSCPGHPDLLMLEARIKCPRLSSPYV